MKKKLCSLILAAAVSMTSFTVPVHAASGDDLKLTDQNYQEMTAESSEQKPEEVISQEVAKTASETENNLADEQETEVREGICQAEDGNYYYYQNNEIDNTRTDVMKGTVNGVSGWWCVQNGQVNLDFFGFAENMNGWFYLEGGKVIFSKNEVTKGTVNGVSGWWNVKNGRVDFTDTVAKNAYGWWCIQNGKVNFSFNGFAENQYGWFYLESGKVIFSKNEVTKGTVKGETAWWNVKNGQVVFTDTVAKNANGWWCIQNGKVNFSFTGIAANSYGNWYCKNGKVDFSYNGIVTYNGQKWSVVNGKATVYVATPKLVSAVNAAKGITVTWSSAEGADGYNIYRAKAGSAAWSLIATVTDGTQVSYTDTTAVLAKPYVYTVRARSGDALSGYDKRGIYGIHSSDAAYTYALKIVNSVTTASMNNEARLKACYYWYRDNTSYKRSTEDPLSLPDTSWIPRYAKELFSTGAGNCYRHACSFAYIATVLGYDPTIVAGGVGSEGAAHGWVEIPIDGVTYVFDEEYQFTWERRGKIYNMFKVTYSTYPFPLSPQKWFKIPVS